MPEVSVILPVYNADAYLREAIDSILSQTFTDFELIILNDGSTDGSASIIHSYTDQRIRAVNNEGNKGLIFTLNRGIDLAKGKFIARMDADDIALPERLEKQMNYCRNNDVAFLSTTVKLIDADGEHLPDWEYDKRCISATEIRKFLVKDNCIAHPSILGKADLFQHYRYRADQKYSEDYDLWLRVIADGFMIGKLSEPLLLHRILPTSATRFKRINVFFRLAKVKLQFFLAQPHKNKFKAYPLRVLVYAILDLAKAGVKEIKAFVLK